MYYYLITTIIIEYAWMWLNKQDSEYAYGPKYANILNMAKFWTWQGSQYASVSQRLNMPENALLDRDLNIYRVLIMPVFWIWNSYTGFQICHNMTEYVWIRLEYAWKYLNLRSEYASYNT